MYHEEPNDTNHYESQLTYYRLHVSKQGNKLERTSTTIPVSFEYSEYTNRLKDYYIGCIFYDIELDELIAYNGTMITSGGNRVSGDYITELYFDVSNEKRDLRYKHNDPTPKYKPSEYTSSRWGIVGIIVDNDIDLTDGLSVNGHSYANDVGVALLYNGHKITYSKVINRKGLHEADIITKLNTKIHQYKHIDFDDLDLQYYTNGRLSDDKGIAFDLDEAMASNCVNSAFSVYKTL